MIFFTTSEFDKDFKRLLKKFRTLEEDFETMKKSAITLYHSGIRTNAIVEIEGYCSDK